MNLDRLHEILRRTTRQLRKGDGVETRNSGGVEVAEIYLMPHADIAAEAGFEAVDLEFIVVGVDRAAAEPLKDELVALLESYPEADRLAAGPSYIEVGGELGDQGAALQLFALGKVLGLWDVITPARLGVTGVDARQLAGRGYIMITGFRRGGPQG